MTQFKLLYTLRKFLGFIIIILIIENNGITNGLFLRTTLGAMNLISKSSRIN